MNGSEFGRRPKSTCTLAEKECTLHPTRKQLKRIPTHVRSLGAF